MAEQTWRATALQRYTRLSPARSPDLDTPLFPLNLVALQLVRFLASSLTSISPLPLGFFSAAEQSLGLRGLYLVRVSSPTSFSVLGRTRRKLFGAALGRFQAALAL